MMCLQFRGDRDTIVRPVPNKSYVHAYATSRRDYCYNREIHDASTEKSLGSIEVGQGQHL
jgi:hypothetical protein